MSLQKFIQNNCIILQLRLSHRSVSPPNESKLHQSLAMNLQKLGNVLYSSSNAARWGQTLQRGQPTIDLVLSSPDVNLLSLVLFNLQGFVAEGGPVSMGANDIHSMFALHQSPSLKRLYAGLTSKWASTDHRLKSGSREAQPFINMHPWVFRNEPKYLARTVSNGTMALATTEQIEGEAIQPHEFYGSRFFDFGRYMPVDLSDGESNTKDHDFVHHSTIPLRNGPGVVSIEPLLYPDFDSLPVGLKHWLDGVTEEEVGSLQKEDATRLNFILNGFKGFER